MSEDPAVTANPTTNGGNEVEVASTVPNDAPANATGTELATMPSESEIVHDASAAAAALGVAMASTPATTDDPITNNQELGVSPSASLDERVQQLASELKSLKEESQTMHKATLQEMNTLSTLVSGLQTQLKASAQHHAQAQAQVRSANANPPFKIITIGGGTGRLGMFINEEVLLKKYNCCYVDYLSEENSVADLGVRQGNYFVHSDTWDHMTESELCELVKNRPFTVGVLPSRAAMMEFIKAKKGAEFSATKRTFAEMNSDYGMPDSEKKQRLGGLEAAGLFDNNNKNNNYSNTTMFRTATAYPPGIRIVTIPSGEVLKDAATLVEHKHKSQRFCFVRRVKPDHQIIFGLIRSDNVFFCAETGRLLNLQEMYELMESSGPFRVGVLPSRNVAEILLLNSSTYF